MEQIVKILSETLVNSIEYLIMMYFVLMFYSIRSKKRFLLGMLIATAMPPTIIVLFNIEFNMITNLIIHIIFYYTGCIVSLETINTKQKIYLLLLLPSVNMLNLPCEAIVFTIMDRMGVTLEMILQYGYFRILLIIPVKILWFLLVKYVVLPVGLVVLKALKEYDSKTKIKMYTVGVLIIVVGLVAIEHAYIAGGKVHYTTPMVIVSMMGLVAIVGTLMLVTTHKLIAYFEEEKNWKVSEERYKSQLAEMEAVKALSEELRAERHEYGNHLGTLSMLASEQDFVDLRVYLSQLIATHDSKNEFNIPQLPLISSILKMKRDIIERQNIEFSKSINLQTNFELVAFQDVSIIVNNMINNAIEATIKRDDEKYIDFDISINHKSMIIEVCNNAIPEDVHKVQSLNFESSKRDKKNHGYGVNNIDYIVRKHNGEFDIRVENNEVFTSVTLPLESIC